MRLIKLEALRGFAALYVVLSHTLPYTYSVAGYDIAYLLRFGQEAVILFFLLSGFVIHYSFHHSRDTSFKHYFLKRFTRIYLPLLMVMLFGFIAASIAAGGLIDPELKTLGLNLLMLQDVGDLKPNVITETYMLNYPLWSLSYEWWFYMIFFLVITLFKAEKTQTIVIFSIAILSAIVYIYYPEFLPRLLMYISIWWTGLYLSQKYISGSKMNYSDLWFPLVGLATVCLVLSIKAFNFYQSDSPFFIGAHPILELRHHLFALFVVIAAIAWKKVNWVGFNYLFSPFIVLAPISYAMYISHHYFYVSASYFAFLGHPVFEWVGNFIALIIFSWIVEVVIYPKLQKLFFVKRKHSKPNNLAVDTSTPN